ncbi:hypothetical protein AJ79_01667 [Helicocarpus griseus UAMH5409]|uniref:Uncharacterized protein n=1 Tax=Helicocarpus griseus UAMH5409 TaxID=1447875 RepID=A0A2B7Y6C6_9EURO|nr:hypothetical protein AJ79_01667 [Helicocarpus griseus UAMH5409]
MSQRVPPPEGPSRAAPMKARRGGISLGGKRKLSQSEVFRRPGTIHFGSHSYQCQAVSAASRSKGLATPPLSTAPQSSSSVAPPPMTSQLNPNGRPATTHSPMTLQPNNVQAPKSITSQTNGLAATGSPETISRSKNPTETAIAQATSQSNDSAASTMANGVPANQTRVDFQKEPFNKRLSQSPEPDLDDDSVYERAQSLLHQFLCTSSTKTSKNSDSEAESRPGSGHLHAPSPPNALKRTADGEVKKSPPNEVSFKPKDDDLKGDTTPSAALLPDKGLVEKSSITQSSSSVSNTSTTESTTITPTPGNHSGTPIGNIQSLPGTSLQIGSHDLKDNQHSANEAATSNLSSSSIPSGSSGLATTSPPSSNPTPTVVLPQSISKCFSRPGLPASSNPPSAKPTEKPARKKPGPKPKNRLVAMSLSDSSSSSFIPSDASTAPGRRSRRTRGAPTNYYAKPFGYPGYQSEDEEETNVTEPSSPQNDTATAFEPGLPLVPVPEPVAPQIRSIYRRGYLQIQQEPLDVPVDDMFDEDDDEVPYSSHNDRNGYGEKCAGLVLAENDSEGHMIHVDFDLNEMEALHQIMIGMSLPESDNDLTISSDIGLPDLLIQTTRKLYPLLAQRRGLARRVEKLGSLHKTLFKFNSSPIEFLCRLRDTSSWPEFEILDREANREIMSCLKSVCNLKSLAGTIHDALIQMDVDFFENLLSMLSWVKSLRHRSRLHLIYFLSDAVNGFTSSTPHLLRAISSSAGYSSLEFDRPSPSALLHSRELGNTVYRQKAIKQKLQTSKLDLEMKKWKHWKGASNDVMVLTWSPDGTRFAAGAAAQSDEHNMIYNRNNNLLLGDLTCNSLKELPDHHIPRPPPHNVVDPKLFMTVSAAAWRGNSLYTASYDKTVKVWDVSSHSGAKCVNTLQHDERVMVMAVSDSGSVATGWDSGPRIKLWNRLNSGEFSSVDLTCHPSKNVHMVPSALTWGPASACTTLVAGMAGLDSAFSRNGHLALWQMGESAPMPLSVSPNSQTVFDIAWHPVTPIFATASSVPFSVSTLGLANSTRSLIRIYDPLRSRAYVFYECPALDINDVTFCPANSNYITASCTDGATYVWDHRNPGKILHKLPHGAPIAEQDPNLSREQHDTGVRVALWKNNMIDQFYTGGSDGVLKKWNILRAPENVLVGDTACFDHGIMSGAFSPDSTNLLVGDSCGKISILSSAPFSGDHNETELAYEASAQKEEQPILSDTSNASADDLEDIRRLFSSGKLSRHSIYGVGQGPRYDGPYAAWARPNVPREALSRTPLLPEIKNEQLDGPPLDLRQLTEEKKRQLSRQIQLSSIRNQQHGKNKRKAGDMFSASSSFSPPVYVPYKVSDHTHTYINLESSDDDDDDDVAQPEPRPGNSDGPAFIDLTNEPSEEGDVRDRYETLSWDDEVEVESLCELLEDDHWWPRNSDVDPNISDD